MNFIKIFVVSALLMIHISCREKSILEREENKTESTSIQKNKLKTDRLADIPLGSTLASLDLDHYESYGEFIGNHFLDFYYIDNPTYPPLGINSKQLMLYFSDGLLIKKRYTFENDIVADIENKFLKEENYVIPKGMKRLNLTFKTKSLSYVRGDSFMLYESLK